MRANFGRLFATSPDEFFGRMLQRRRCRLVPLLLLFLNLIQFALMLFQRRRYRRLYFDILNADGFSFDGLRKPISAVVVIVMRIFPFYRFRSGFGVFFVRRRRRNGGVPPL